MNLATSLELPRLVPLPAGFTVLRSAPWIVARVRRVDCEIGLYAPHGVKVREERLYRADDCVWIEPILSDAERDQAHQRNANGEPVMRHTAKFIRRRHDGGASLSLVSEEERLIIDVDPADFDALGFDGDFDAASHLLSTQDLYRMIPGRGTRQGRWYESKTEGEHLYVLWSHVLQLAVAIESTRTARRSSVHAVVERRSGLGPGLMPWDRLAGFRQIRFQDLGAD